MALATVPNIGNSIQKVTAVRTRYTLIIVLLYLLQIQLLPSTISKLIFMYLPMNYWGEYARVNKYWTYLVDELRMEVNVRQKINIELEKMKDNMFLKDVGIDLVSKSNSRIISPGTSSTKMKREPTIVKFSIKSAAISLKATDGPKKLLVQKPIPNMKELNERLERRGAADENIWKWCTNVLKYYKKYVEVDNNFKGGMITLGEVYFPCPLMANKLTLPLVPPLVKTPTTYHLAKVQTNAAHSIEDSRKISKLKRYSIWTTDLSELFPIAKISSYHFK